MTKGVLEKIIEAERQSLNKSIHIQRGDPTFLPIQLTGGIGDVIISIDSVLELSKHHQIVVYSQHAEAFKYFCPDAVPVFKSLPEYTWHLDFNTVAEFQTSPSFHGFLIKDHEELFLKQLDMFKIYPVLEQQVKASKEKYYLTSLYAKELGINRREFPMFTLGQGQLGPMKFSGQRKPKNQITVHDGYDTANFDEVTGRSTKQWGLGHWKILISELKKKYPDHIIIQLGAKTSREIPDVDISLVNKTSVAEAFDILSSSALHIDGDSGLVHAATRMQVPCVVMFGPTPDYFYGYPQNINIRNSPCKHACFWYRRNWMNQCALEYPTAKCMDDITPDMVLAAAETLLKEKGPAFQPAL